MAGNQEFSESRLRALCEEIWARSHMDAERLHLLCYFIDFDAYRKLGASLTGATYVAGAKGPEVADVPSSWWRSFVRSKTPWWARALAVPVVLYVLASAGKDDA